MIWFIRSKLPLLPTPPCVAPGSCVSGAYSSCGFPRHGVEGSWGTAAGQPADRHTLHFTRGNRVNTNLAFSENLLSKSTQKSPLTSAEAGLGQCLALLRVFHLSLQVAKQDTPARTHPSGAGTAVETTAQRSVSALGFSRSRFTSKPTQNWGTSFLGSCRAWYRGTATSYKVPTAWPRCLWWEDPSWEFPEGEMPQEDFRTRPPRKVRCLLSYFISKKSVFTNNWNPFWHTS